MFSRLGLPVLAITIVAVVLGIVGCSVSSDKKSTDAPSPWAAGAPDAVDAVLAAFESHDLVAFGQAHELLQEKKFLETLLRDERLPGVANIIVVEFGNAIHQRLVDQYIQGGAVTIEQLRPVWRDLVGVPPGQLDGPADFFRTIREVNSGLPQSRRFRVLLGDPPFDWKKLRSASQLGPILMSRDSFFASVVEKNILKRGQKALLLSGGLHFARLGSSNPVGVNAIGEIEDGQKAAYIILPYAGIGEGRRAFERLFAGRATPVIAPTGDDELRAIRANRILPQLVPFDNPSPPSGGGPPATGGNGAPPPSPANGGSWVPPPTSGEPTPLPAPGTTAPGVLDPYAGLTLGEIADAVIFYGGCGALKMEPISRAPLSEVTYRAELDRRSRILTGQPFVPPPNDPAGSYCP